MDVHEMSKTWAAATVENDLRLKLYLGLVAVAAVSFIVWLVV